MPFHSETSLNSWVDYGLQVPRTEFMPPPRRIPPRSHRSPPRPPTPLGHMKQARTARRCGRVRFEEIPVNVEKSIRVSTHRLFLLHQPKIDPHWPEDECESRSDFGECHLEISYRLCGLLESYEFPSRNLANVDPVRQAASSVVIVKENNALRGICNVSASCTARFVNVC